MSPRQSVEVDPARKLVIVTITGCFTPHDAHAATWETRRAIQSLGGGVGQHLTLYDMTAAAPSPAETVDLIRMGFLNPIYKPLWARKVAFCTASPLLRRQIERIREARPDMAILETRDEALAWLLAD